MREWLRFILSYLAKKDLDLPLLLHCRRGRDRTGVVVAVLLLLLGVPHKVIVQEYALSQPGAKQSNIEEALATFEEKSSWKKTFSKVDIAQLRTNFLEE